MKNLLIVLLCLILGQSFAQKPKFQRWLEAHTHYVEAVRFLDAQTLLSASAESNKDGTSANRLIYWDFRTGRPIKTLAWGRAGEYIHHLSFSYDGRNLLAGSDRASIYKTSDASVVFQSPVSESIYLTLALSRNEKWLATGNSDGLLEIWDLMRGEVKPVVLFQADCPVNTTFFSPNGQYLFCGLESGIFKVFDISTLQEVGSYEEHTKDIFAINYSEDSRRVATAGWDSFIHFWDIDREQLEYSVRGHEGYIEALEFSPDGQWLASGGGDATVRIWDAKTAELLAVATKHESAVLSLSFSPDGRYLAAGSADTKISIWKFE